MAKRDPRVGAYIARSADFAQPILAHLRATIIATSPQIEETIKWGMPHYLYRGMLCSMAAFKAHCSFGFWKGALVVDGAGKRYDAMGDFGRIVRASDLPAKRTLQRFLRKAMAINAADAPVPRPLKHARPRLTVPPALAAALRRNAKAKATWEAFPPSQRREYAEWVRDAKGEQTRERRLAQSVAWLAAGKARHWK